MITERVVEEWQRHRIADLNMEFVEKRLSLTHSQIHSTFQNPKQMDQMTVIADT